MKIEDVNVGNRLLFTFGRKPNESQFVLLVNHINIKDKVFYGPWEWVDKHDGTGYDGEAEIGLIEYKLVGPIDFVFTWERTLDLGI